MNWYFIYNWTVDWQCTVKFECVHYKLNDEDDDDSDRFGCFFFGKYDNDDNENKRQKQNEWIVTHAYFIMDFYWQ